MAMRKKKHHYKPRRNPRPVDDRVFIFVSPGFLDLAKDIRDRERQVHQTGTAARESGTSALSFGSWKAEQENMGIPRETAFELVRAMYAAYQDGYKGKPFKRRIIIETE